MRRLVLTIFLLFYTASVAGLTVVRTKAWAAQRAHDLKHPRPARGAQISEAQRYSPHQVQTKLLEDGSVLVSSFVRSSDLPHSETALYHRLTGFVADQNGRAVSSRAPPVLL